MDAERFDAFVRSLPRREALGGLISAGLLALAARLTPDAEAKKNKRKRRKRRKRKRKNKRKGKKCEKCAQCETGFTCGSGTKPCGTECIPADGCCGGCGEQQCCDGVCSDCCGAGQSICDGICTNLASDGAHCGDCAIACESDTCTNGACRCQGIFECPTGCSCFSLNGPLGVCAADAGSGASCTVHTDCPLGSACVEVSAGAFVCSDPCVP